jgi:hypothetical protein
MPVATTSQYAEMLDAAAAGVYSYAAVDVSSSETLNAALRGFRDARADGHRRSHRQGGGVLVRGPPERVDDFLLPLIAESAARVAADEPPLFNSHMFDGSTLPLDENLRICADLLAQCAPLGLILEIECGSVGGEEDGITGPDRPRDELYTTPGDLLRVADALGSDRKAATSSPPRLETPTASTRPEMSSRDPRYCATAKPPSPHATPAPASARLPRQQQIQAGRRDRRDRLRRRQDEHRQRRPARVHTRNRRPHPRQMGRQPARRRQARTQAR